MKIEVKSKPILAQNRSKVIQKFERCKTLEGSSNWPILAKVIQKFWCCKYIEGS